MKLALGTVQFGLPYGVANRTGRVGDGEAVAILELARSRGMDTLDTAIGYGESEARLGAIGIQGWQVVSKLPSIPAGCEDINAWVSTAVSGSLARLNIPRLYGLLLHRPHELLGEHGQTLYRALQRLKSEGLVEKIGVSIYEPSPLDHLLGRYDLDLLQSPFSILDRRLLDSGWMKRLAQHGVELHVRSVFLQGLLLMHGTRPVAFRRWDSVWESYDSWLSDQGITAAQACLSYVTSFPEVSKVVIGVDSVLQLQENIDASEGDPATVPFGDGTNDPDLLDPFRWPST